RREDPLFVEDAVIRKIDLETHRDRAAVEKRIGVVDVLAFAPRKADEHPGASVGGLPGEAFARLTTDILKRRLENQVLGRIACEYQLRQHDEIRAKPRRLRAGGSRLRLVPGDVPDDGVELGEGETEPVGARVL